MVRLILLNGPPGCGKSTLAQTYVENNALSLNLDIDLVRALLGRWTDQPTEAGLLARSLALAMARTHLLAGHDVVIPQYLGRMSFIEQVEDLARQVDADFYELVLMDSRESSLRRFLERGRATGLPTHLEADEMVSRDGGPVVLHEMYDRLLDVIALRPNARVIHTQVDHLAEAYQELLRCLPDRT